MKIAIICEECERPISEHICPDMVATSDRAAIIKEYQQKIDELRNSTMPSKNVRYELYCEFIDKLSRADL